MMGWEGIGWEGCSGLVLVHIYRRQNMQREITSSRIVIVLLKKKPAAIVNKSRAVIITGCHDLTT